MLWEIRFGPNLNTFHQCLATPIIAHISTSDLTTAHGETAGTTPSILDLDGDGVRTGDGDITIGMTLTGEVTTVGTPLGMILLTPTRTTHIKITTEAVYMV